MLIAAASLLPPWHALASERAGSILRQIVNPDGLTHLLQGRSSSYVMEAAGGVGETPRLYTRGTFLGGRRLKLGIAARL